MNRFVAKVARGAARLAFWRKPVEATPEQSVSPEPAAASSVGPSGAESRAIVDVPPPRSEQLEEAVDASKPAAETNQQEAASSEVSPAGVVPADDSEAQQVSRFGRVLGTLSNKWVWIPGVSIVMLAIIGTMTLLASTQKQLKQTTLKNQAAAPQEAAPQVVAHLDRPMQAVDPVNVAVSSAAKPQPNIDVDCVVTDKESVIKNLKNCIEGFNNAMAR